jgi:hypothetical protein
MAYNGANLTYVAPGNSVTIGRIWHYDAGADNLATVEDNGYFFVTDAALKLRKEDWLQVEASDGLALYLVTASFDPGISGTTVIVRRFANMADFTVVI